MRNFQAHGFNWEMNYLLKISKYFEVPVIEMFNFIKNEDYLYFTKPLYAQINMMYIDNEILSLSVFL